MRHKGARTHREGKKGGGERKRKRMRGKEPRKKDTMQIAVETAAGSPR